MEGSGRVLEIKKDKLQVMMFKESSCAHCSGCGEASKNLREIELTYDENEYTIEVGDIVTFQLADAKVLKIGFLIYVVPILALIIGYYVGTKLGYSEKGSALASIIFMGLSFVGIHTYDKYVIKEKVNMEIVKVEKDSDDLSGVCASKK